MIMTQWNSSSVLERVLHISIPKALFILISEGGVLVYELGNACLADPGLLNVFLNGPLTNSIKTHKTDRWKAPELLGNSPTRTAFASDVYAFTMTSLEILTRKDPFSGLVPLMQMMHFGTCGLRDAIKTPRNVQLCKAMLRG
ncbi:hypothetical protein M422DRAFT_259467 [Sphaerobolus stellatus SS14]|uniref:Protein kinase domain-containing protein n=1 Tax=Sphaerobolus stellatus (strain SS14) TaxID=990650 RepID=A0A0C9U4K2_SPHS4|nr:hypothetical protein M422DRAFT_259467 [Sphaerobolus stellatus SS14]